MSKKHQQDGNTIALTNTGASPFSRLVARMDAVTAERMGERVVIESQKYHAIEEHDLLAMGELAGDGVVLTIFSDHYRPQRQQQVTWKGKEYFVTKHRMFNGKPQVRIE